MLMKDFSNYTVANISEEDVQSISELEKAISNNSNQDIVLIAYRSNKTEQQADQFK